MPGSEWFRRHKTGRAGAGGRGGVRRDVAGATLLRVAEDHDFRGEDGDGWAALTAWFEGADPAAAREASRETNERGETALHVVLRKQGADAGTAGRATSQRQLLQAVLTFDDVCGPDAFRIQTSVGYLPLHVACAQRACGFEVIRAVVEAYPPGLGVYSRERNAQMRRHTPFAWDYDSSIGGHFTEFLQHFVARDDFHRSGSRRSSVTNRHNLTSLLCHCRDYVPLEILKKGMLHKETLQLKAMIRWLNDMPCKRSVVCSMVFELYLHVGWISTMLFATEQRMSPEGNRKVEGPAPYLLLAFAALFLIQELNQLHRFIITNASMAYFVDVWNWIDLATCFLVAATAARFLQDDVSVPSNELLMAAGVAQFILLVSYLKKTFFPFCKFVNGMLKVRPRRVDPELISVHHADNFLSPYAWQICLDLLPFLVISMLTIFAFSFLYYVRENSIPHTSKYGSHEEHGGDYDTLVNSFLKVCRPFAAGPDEETTDGLDLFFGIMIIVILLNVVIAIVNEAWEDASNEVDGAFWNYRLDLIVEKTRGKGGGGFLRGRVFKALFKRTRDRSSDTERLDDIFINDETIGTTSKELKRKLALAYHEEGLFFCLKIIAKGLLYVLLGFPTFGLLWPRFFREMLFTPPAPKEEESKLRMQHLAEEIAECKVLIAKRDKRDKEVLEDIASCRKEVRALSETLNSQMDALSDRLDAQMDLMQKLLSNDD